MQGWMSHAWAVAGLGGCMRRKPPGVLVGKSGGKKIENVGVPPPNIPDLSRSVFHALRTSTASWTASSRSRKSSFTTYLSASSFAASPSTH